MISRMRPLYGLLLTGCLVSLSALGCDADKDNSVATSNTNKGSTDVDPTCTSSFMASHFLADALTSPVEEVDCTLSDGTATTCYKISIPGKPADHNVGPFCPRSINDTAEDVGIWLSGGTVYDVDGDFIKGLATFYQDSTWKLYDDTTGVVRVTLTKEACEAAARPDVDPEYNNYCVECSLDDVGGGIATELLIPKTPVYSESVSEIGMNGGVGVSLNGVQFDPPAPVAAILAAHTIAAFDDCGGHVNPFEGYHYHAATGCSAQIAQCDAHAPLIGYARDGYGLYAMASEGGTEPADLDECRGHTDTVRGYHYHVASAGENMFIGCFHGKTVGVTTTTPGNMMPGGDMTDAAACTAQQTTMCCGDGTCDGPETAANCAADCS